MAIVAYCDLELHQVDVKIAFPNDKLGEQIYMKQLEDFIVHGHEDRCLDYERHYMDLNSPQDTINFTKP